jgi:hypothetical protein
VLVADCVGCIAGFSVEIVPTKKIRRPLSPAEKNKATPFLELPFEIIF